MFLCRVVLPHGSYIVGLRVLQPGVLPTYNWRTDSVLAPMLAQGAMEYHVWLFIKNIVSQLSLDVGIFLPRETPAPIISGVSGFGALFTRPALGLSLERPKGRVAMRKLARKTNRAPSAQPKHKPGAAAADKLQTIEYNFVLHQEGAREMIIPNEVQMLTQFIKRRDACARESTLQLLIDPRMLSRKNRKTYNRAKIGRLCETILAWGASPPIRAL
ncbi:hypothetical protein Ciccas_005477 [Cichlidogyrus casuarinus]|uniref:Uncharacterized protein n=1 Tax=Cichlidogyrus casuarinus TaxID=1844966 RepID=A0ABD2Q8I5_9PLAT